MATRDAIRDVNRAVVWGRSRHGGMSNYEALISELNLIRTSLGEANLQAPLKDKRDIVGNMLTAAKARLINDRKMPRELYPVLLRISLMDYPQLAFVDRPIGHTEYDTQRVKVHLRLAFRDITGRRPSLTSWELALNS